MGGRRVHPSTLARGSTPMLFSDDNTVSRMHFEVSFGTSELCIVAYNF